MLQVKTCWLWVVNSTSEVQPLALTAQRIHLKHNFASDGYTTDDIVYKWEMEDDVISPDAKEHLHNDGWEVTSTQKADRLIGLPTGLFSLQGNILRMLS